jgi:hypothetical protein
LIPIYRDAVMRGAFPGSMRRVAGKREAG